MAHKTYTISQGIDLPHGRGGHAAAVFKNTAWVVGGTDWSRDHTKKTWLSDSIYFRNGSWHPGPILPHPVAYSLFASDETGLYLAGGTDGINKLDTVYHLKNIGNHTSWVSLPPLPKAVTSGGAALLNGILYVIGGWVYPDKITNHMWSLDVTEPQAQWQLCQKLPGCERAFPALVACDESLYLFGGMSPDSKTKSLGVMKDAYHYNPEENEWQQLPDMPFSGYAWSGCAIDKNHIMLAGRADGEIHKDIWLIDVRNFSFKKIGDAIIQTTTAPLLKVNANEFWLIAGEPDSNKNRTKTITIILLEQ